MWEKREVHPSIVSEPEIKSALAGERGEAARYAVEVLVEVSNALGNGKLIEVETAHISGVSYLTIGEWGIRFLEDVVRLGARFKVLTTVNPMSFDLEGIISIDGTARERQERIMSLLLSMGASTTFSCAPYDIVATREWTAHAWAESSASAYINTFRNAMSDKLPGPLALLAGLTGWAPYTPMYTFEGRVPKVSVRLGKVELDPLTAGLLGREIGIIAGDRVPLVRGRVKFVSEEARREFAASFSTYSTSVLAVIEGITPSWDRYVAAADIVEEASLDVAEIAKALRDSDPASSDAVLLGCPFMDLDSVLRIIGYIREKHGHRRARIPIYITTSRFVVEALGPLVKNMEVQNVHIVGDACLVVSPYTRRFKRIATDSTKAAFYLPKLHGIYVDLCRPTECVDGAFR